MAKRAAAFFLMTAMACGAALAADRPGQKFHLKASTLPKPYATPPVDNRNEVIARPGNAMPQAPKGFQVTLFATGFTAARFLAVAPNGDVFLSERLPAKNVGRILLLRDSRNIGVADQRFTFADGLRNPSGIAVHRGYVYISDQNAIWRTPYVAGATKAGKLEKVTRAKDLRLTAMHGTRNFAFGADGSLLLEIGSKDNLSDYRPGAEIFKVVNGNLVPYASGLRNPVGIAFQPGTNNLYVSVNERDGLGDGLAPDFFTYVKPGGFYGYPWAYSGKIPDPDMGAARPDMVAKSITPDVLFPAHSAPTGTIFYTGGNFPAEYNGDAFVSLHGSWNSSKPTGYKVVRIRFKNGRPVGGYENFLTGFWDGRTNPFQVWGRPVGLAVYKDGSLLVADDVSNTVWKVTYRK